MLHAWTTLEVSDPLADLRARGLVQQPTLPKRKVRGRKRLVAAAPVSPRRRAATLIVYFDTSALIKLVFDEPGSDVAGELWDRAEAVASSQLIYPEARAAAAAAQRGGRIDTRTLRAAVRTIDELCRELDVIGLDHALGRTAGELAERHALRGYDAVHLASATAIDDPDLVIATWDRELALAAIAQNHTIVPTQQ